jgi:pimeloyl-ACP methyl ester carboxylesterase
MRGFLATAVLAAIVCPTGARADQHSFDSNGVKISYLEEGRGEPVVLLHGFSVSSAMWAKIPGAEIPLLPALAKEYRVIAPDFRGHGQSDKPHDPKQYGNELAEDVIRLLDHLQVHKAHVVGYSMGSTVAGKLLVSHPDRLRSVTFGGGGPWFRPPRGVAAAVEATADSLEQGKGLGPLLIALTPEGQPKPSPEQAAARSQLLLRDQDPKALALVLRGQPRLEVTEEQLKANKVPVCFVYGSREGELKELITGAQKVLAKATVRVVENGDHLSTPSRLEFRKAVLEFLRAHGE